MIGVPLRLVHLSDPGVGREYTRWQPWRGLFNPLVQNAKSELVLEGNDLEPLRPVEWCVLFSPPL